MAEMVANCLKSQTSQPKVFSFLTKMQKSYFKKAANAGGIYYIS